MDFDPSGAIEQIHGRVNGFLARVPYLLLAFLVPNAELFTNSVMVNTAFRDGDPAAGGS